jgi:hypothetical protein
MAPLPNSGLVSAFVAKAVPISLPPVDMEADGVEAQRPPPMRMYAQPDDPTQPFSPNYGSIPLGVPAEPDAAPAPPTKEAAIRNEHPI